MFGTYQHSNLRIEVSASADEIKRGLTEISALKQWLWPQKIKVSGPQASRERLSEGQLFESQLLISQITHQVELLSPQGIRLLLSGGIDGFHEWQWGDGWGQSRLDGISLLPLNLGQTASLSRLKYYLTAQSSPK